MAHGDADMSRMVFYGAVQVFTDDALTALKAVPSSSAQACLTSPPFYLLRKYGASANWPDGWEGELGHEPHRTISYAISSWCSMKFGGSLKTMVASG